MQNDFGPPDRALGHPPLKRVNDPGSFTFTWYPDLDTGPKGVDDAGPAGQIGPTTDYWVSGLAGRDTRPGRTATVVADSAAIPEPAVALTRTTTGHPVPDPTPYIESTQIWRRGATPAPSQALSLELTNVAAVRVDTRAAGLRCGTVAVHTDGPTELTLTGLAEGSPVTEGASAVGSADRSGSATVDVTAGTTTLQACSG